MAWHTVKSEHIEQYLIMNEDESLVVGSIVQSSDGRYHVEILFMAGDLTHSAPDYANALSFVIGVEAAFIAMGMGR